MVRKLALTIIPGVAILSVATLACLAFSAPRHATAPATLAARSGYIVASS